jgi:hypothetical protein
MNAAVRVKSVAGRERASRRHDHVDHFDHLFEGPYQYHVPFLSLSHFFSLPTTVLACLGLKKIEAQLALVWLSCAGTTVVIFRVIPVARRGLFSSCDFVDSSSGQRRGAGFLGMAGFE